MPRPPVAVGGATAAFTILAPLGFTVLISIDRGETSWCAQSLATTDCVRADVRTPAWDACVPTGLTSRSGTLQVPRREGCPPAVRAAQIRCALTDDPSDAVVSRSASIAGFSV